MNIHEQNKIMYDALRAIDRRCPDVGAGGDDAYAMQILALDAIDTIEADPAPKTLEELREILTASDKICVHWGELMETCSKQDEPRVVKQYFIACELSRAAFHAVVNHPDWSK
jgi:hypothetical protein